MVAYLRSRSQRFPVALIAGAVLAAIVAATVFTLPGSILGQIADVLSLNALPSAALRPVAALAGGMVIGAIGWAIVVLTVGTHIVLHAWQSETPVLRPADSHPDAPARSPIRASAELGPPLELEPAAQPMPADLDQPLAAFDAAALPETPREPARPVAPLVRPERIETFELTPLVRDHAASPPSLASLLDRLERSAGQHPRHPARSLEQALGALRDSAA